MQTVQQNQLGTLIGQLAGARLGDEPAATKAGPPSLRPKRSQRFTVAASNISTPLPVPIVSVPTVHAPPLDRGSSNTSLSVSSVSDETESNSSPSTPIYTSYSSSTALNPAAAPVQPFQNQSYHMTLPSTGVPYITPPNTKGRANNTGNYNGASRSGIPIQWMDPGAQQAGHMTPYLQPFPVTQVDDDEVIPNAIVIKNIPFSVRREQLLAIIDDLMIPPPYAFNYHFDNGIFRGLAFANFRLASEADAAVAGLNGFDLSGRKLRVEYKKVLQAGEKERIEKEKAIKRMRSMQMQKEENLGVVGLGSTTYARSREPSFVGDDDFGEVLSPAQLGSRGLIPPNPPVFPGGGSPSHSGIALPTTGEYSGPGTTGLAPSGPPTSSVALNEKLSKDLDMNDPQTLEIYSRVLLFKDDPMRDELSFARSLAAGQRRIVHQVAKKLGLEHKSEGYGDDRHVVVMKGSGAGTERGSRSRQSTLGRSAGNALLPRDTYGSGLRGKKSMPDMRSSGSHSQPLGAPSDRNTLTRRSNANLREGYATSARRASSGNSSSHRSDTHTIFSNFPGSLAPPVPALPGAAGEERTIGSSTVGGVVRQPRGPEAGKGFCESWQQARMGNVASSSFVAAGDRTIDSIDTMKTDS